MEDLDVYRKLAHIVGLYDSPVFESKDVKPWYYEYYSWIPFGTSTDICIGELKEEIFDTFPKKVYYLKGIFEKYGAYTNSKDLTSSLTFPNSQKTVERVKIFLAEFTQKSINPPQPFLFSSFPSGVRSHTTLYLCPVCHSLEIYREVWDAVLAYTS